MDYLTKATHNLPNGWAWTTVRQIGDLIRGVSYKKEEASKEPRPTHLPILRANNIGKELVFNDVVYVPEHRVDLEQLITEGDIVFAMSSGSKDLVGKAAQAKKDLNAGFGAFCGLFRPSDELEKRFAGYFFQSADYKDAIAKLSSGVNINNLRRSHIEDLSFPLPPFPEQHRIVAKIEELFSDLDAGVEALKKVKAELKRYRQAVLKAAVEGKLTEQWREKNKGKLEPASVLLERIRAERAKLGKAKKLPAVDTSELPRLPEGWGWVRVGELISEPQYGTPRKCSYEQKGTPVLRIPNIVNGRIEKSDLKYALFSQEEVKQFKLSDGDILIIRSNGSLSLVGRAALVSMRDSGYLFAGYLIRIRPIPGSVLSEYLKWLFDSDLVRSQIERKAKSTSGVNNVNAKELAELIIPFCSAPEQQRIVSEVEQRRSVADEVEKTVDAGLKQAERLRQSILKRAFEGKLVPQDPSDEPAEKLLERIRAAHGNAAPVRRTKRKRRKT